MKRRRVTRTRVDQSFLESLKALERLYVSGGGGAEKASGEDESPIPAASSGFDSKRALYPNLAAGFWEHDAPVQEERVTS